MKNEKQKEFHQTVRFILNHLSADCLGSNLAHDVNDADLYHFYSLWSSEGSLRKFENSNEFQMLKGAFKTLGNYQDTMWGKKSELTLFDLNNLDNNQAVE